MSDWTRTETISPPNEVEISYLPLTATSVNDQTTVLLTSTTRGTNETTYTPINYTDRDGKPQVSEVATLKVDTTWTTIASVNNDYVSWRLSQGLGLPSGGAKSEDITTSEYTVTVDGPVLIKETVEHYVSMAEMSGGLQLAEWGDFRPSGEEMVLAHRTIREIDQAKTAAGRDVTRTKTSRWIARAELATGKNDTAKRIAEIYALFEGFPSAVEPTIRKSISLIYEGTEVQIETGRMPVAEKPSDQDLIRNRVANGRDDLTSDATPVDAYGNNKGWPAFVPPGIGSSSYFLEYLQDKDGDGEPDYKDHVPQDPSDYDQDSDGDGVPDWAPYVPGDWEDFDQDSDGDGTQDWEEYVPVGDDFDTDDVDFTTDETTDNEKTITGIVLFNGSTFNPDDITTTASYDMPFAPDDYFAYVKGIPKLIRGNARAAAEAFGRTESALDVGHAYGQNIVTGWNETPTLDLSSIYVQLANIEGAFLMDSTSYAWGPDGMVVSSDLMLLGVSGYYGASAPASSWLRLPVPVAGLRQVTAGTTGTASKANSIAIPMGFNARNPGPVLATLPSTGTDAYALFRSSQVLVAPTLELEQTTLATGPSLRAREFDYGLILNPEVAVLATGPVAIDAVVVLPPVAQMTLTSYAPSVPAGAEVLPPVAQMTLASDAPSVNPNLIYPPTSSLALTSYAPAVVTGDPYFANVSLLLPMDGSNGSTTFTDASSNALTVTRNGNAQISTVWSKWGGSSGLFDGSSSWLDLPDNAALEPGGGDFTWEFWIKTATSIQYASIYSRSAGTFGAGKWNLTINNFSATSGDITLYVGDYSTSADLMHTTGVSVRDDSEHFCQVVRSGSSWAINIDGVQRASATWSGAISDIAAGSRLCSDGSGTYHLAAYIDDFRITKGIARPNVVPTGPFPTY